MLAREGENFAGDGLRVSTREPNYAQAAAAERSGDGYDGIVKIQKRRTYERPRLWARERPPRAGGGRLEVRMGGGGISGRLAIPAG